MRKTLTLALVAFLVASCSQKSYQVSNISTERLMIIHPKKVNQKRPMAKLVAKYKVDLDTEMNTVIGHSTVDLNYGRPESPLTNLTSDVMLAYGKDYAKGNCDVAFMNVHGHRSNLAKGDITIGNVFEVYPFENKLSIVKLKGRYLKEAFESYAKMGGAGISGNVKLVAKNKELKNVTINGKKIDNNKVYTIITLDYLAEGNDGMDAFKNAIEITETGENLRDIMNNYIKEKYLKGESISANVDGRIVIEK